ncbi:MAG: hypothetical protein ACR2NN_27680 [Bryobacteraceae bacterium]
MNRLFLFLLLAGVFALGLALFRSRASRTPGTDPHASEEIHKAQKRN